MMVLVGLGYLKSNVGMLRFKVILELECVLEPPQLTCFCFSNNHGVGGDLGGLASSVCFFRSKDILEFECVRTPIQLT